MSVMTVLTHVTAVFLHTSNRISLLLYF